VREAHLCNVTRQQSQSVWHSNHGNRTCATSAASKAKTPGTAITGTAPVQRQLEAKPKHLAQQSRELHLNNVSWKQSQNTWHSNDGNRTCATSAASKAKIPGTAITGTAPVQCHSAAKPKYLAQQSREPHLCNVSCKQSENTWHSNHGDRTCAMSLGSKAKIPGTAMTGTAPKQRQLEAKRKYLAQQSRGPHLCNVTRQQSQNTWHSNDGNRT